MFHEALGNLAVNVSACVMTYTHAAFTEGRSELTLFRCHIQQNTTDSSSASVTAISACSYLQ